MQNHPANIGSLCVVFFFSQTVVLDVNLKKIPCRAARDFSIKKIV